jgi:hypothetical protein
MMRPEGTLESVGTFSTVVQDGFYFRTADPALCAGLISGVAPRRFSGFTRNTRRIKSSNAD